MRIIGHLDDEALAHRFGDHLYAQGVPNQVEAENNGTWAVWVADEGDLDRAGGLLTRFLQNPNDAAYQSARKAAEEKRAAAKADAEAAAKRVFGRNDVIRPTSSYGVGPLTFVLIMACIAVFMWSKMGTDVEAIQSLFITEFVSNGVWYPHPTFLPEVRHGEIWRLVTPMLIHFGWMHIIFNMMWLFQLGSLIEARQGSGRFLALVLALALFSNVMQIWITRSPVFGGMSGVVYGLIGYIWLRGKFDPASGLALDRQTLIMSLIWFGACFTGMLGPVANWVHAGGLVLGMAWGFLSAKAKWKKGSGW